MAKVPMTAVMRQTYDGRALKTGDQFEAASEAEADDLEAVRVAVRRKAPKPPAVVTRVMDSEARSTEANDENPADPSPPTSATPSTRTASTKGGTYNRSDVRSGR